MLLFCRDHLIYAASASSKSLSEVTELMSEVVLKPKITENEVRFGTHKMYVFIFRRLSVWKNVDHFV